MAEKTRGILLAIGLFGFAAVAVGCGGNGNDLDQFTGTWQYTSSQGTYTCPGQPDGSGPYGTTKRWGTAASADLVDMTPSIFDFGTQCFYLFDVKDKVATIQPAQTCQFFDSTGGTHEEAPSMWTFTLTSATTAVENFQSSIDAMCALTAGGELKRVSTD
jgi:hypothetical protein